MEFYGGMNNLKTIELAAQRRLVAADVFAAELYRRRWTG
jgi:hypothetical protein